MYVAEFLDNADNELLLPVCPSDITVGDVGLCAGRGPRLKGSPDSRRRGGGSCQSSTQYGMLLEGCAMARALRRGAPRASYAMGLDPRYYRRRIYTELVVEVSPTGGEGGLLPVPGGTEAVR